MGAVYDKMKIRYEDTRNWTNYFLGVTLTLILSSISMAEKNPGLSSTFFMIGMFLGVVSIMIFAMKEYRYFKIIGYLNKEIGGKESKPVFH